MGRWSFPQFWNISLLGQKFCFCVVVCSPFHCNPCLMSKPVKRVPDGHFPYTAPNPCEGNPCLNGGRCRPDPSVRTRYSCTCQPGFVGSNCETRNQSKLPNSMSYS